MVVISIVCAHSFGQSFRSINCAIFRTGSLETVNDVNACVECQGHPWRTSRPRSSSSSMRKVCQLWFFGDPSLRLKFVHLLTKPAGLFIFVSIALASMCPKADHNLQQFSGQHWTPITSFTSFWVSNVIMLLSQPRWTLRCFAALGSVTAGVAVSFYIPNRQILSNFDPTFWFQVSDYIIIYRIHILTLQYTTVHYHIIYVYIYIYL